MVGAEKACREDSSSEVIGGDYVRTRFRNARIRVVRTRFLTRPLGMTPVVNLNIGSYGFNVVGVFFSAATVRADAFFTYLSNQRTIS
jgi:hypothetical protein